AERVVSAWPVPDRKSPAGANQAPASGFRAARRRAVWIPPPLLSVLHGGVVVGIEVQRGRERVVARVLGNRVESVAHRRGCETRPGDLYAFEQHEVIA